MKRSIILIVAIAAAMVLTSGCFINKPASDPNDENLRYIYFTVWPKDANLSITVEFKDETPTFHDERTTKEHEPIVYSIDRRKVKKITVKVEKYGWVTQTMVWEGADFPVDVFIKLEEQI